MSQPPAPDLPQGTRRRVLVVEDDPAINDAVTRRLAAEEYDVMQAWDGPAAVAAATGGRPDVLVLDVMLPGFDRLEVCRRVQATRPVPVLMLTARDDEAVGGERLATPPIQSCPGDLSVTTY